MEHGIVYRAQGRFGGWPANNGIWAWGNEIVVGFTLGYLDPEKRRGHPIEQSDRVPAQARSLDGGATWEVDEHPQLLPEECAPIPCSGDITFTQLDFAMKFQRTGEHAGDTSWFYISYDRCKSWHGPYQMPMLGLKGMAARTDYQVYGNRECLVFLTAPKSDDREGLALCARTVDGGKTFQFVSWITPELRRFSIMPSTVRLPGGRLLVAVRCDAVDEKYLDVYASDDCGQSWQHLSRPDDTHGSNPPAMIRLADGRICLTYGHREEPYGMCTRLSEDNGATWGEEIVLRDDAGTADLGYPRSVQRPDGKILTVYYYNDPPTDNEITERYIGSTIWEA